MSVPVTGPYTKTHSVVVPVYGGCTVAYRYQHYYRQKRKYPMVPLAYILDDVRVLAASDPSLTWGGAWPGNVYSGMTVDYSADPMEHAINKARAKLVSDLNESSLWAVNLIEMGKTLSLITGPASTLLSAARKIRRFDFGGALRLFIQHGALGSRARSEPGRVSLPRGLKRSSKAFGTNWLAFHFGWEPLVKDIGAAVETLQNPFPWKRITGKGSHSFQGTGGYGGAYWYSTSHTVTSHARMSCRVRVDNPNLYLAQQLGFVNPLSIAWELIPFSFVVDWFSNVGQILGQMSEFAGVEITDPYTTRFQVINTSEAAWYGYTHVKRGHFVRRTQGLAEASLRVRPWKGVSTVRAATAISLLTQFLKG